MSPIKSQTLFMQELERINAQHARHVDLLMAHQTEYKECVALIEDLQRLGASKHLAQLVYPSEDGLSFFAYAHHCTEEQLGIFSAILDTRLPFAVVESYAPNLREIIIEGSVLRIVFDADLVLQLRAVE